VRPLTPALDHSIQRGSRRAWGWRHTYPTTTIVFGIVFDSTGQIKTYFINLRGRKVKIEGHVSVVCDKPSW
jgi:hypothetical protein